MDKELVILQSQIENRIFMIRGVQVMLDSDLAEMYCVETKRLNEQVKRNLERFPSDFMFQITESEWEILRSQNATLRFEAPLKSQNMILESTHGKHRKFLPFVFTEQGVAGLSGVLKSETAAKVHVAIMRAFVAMRKIVQDNQSVYFRLDKVEQKQIEADQKFERVFKALEGNAIPTQGIFFDGQIFNAYVFASDLIKSANKSITLIDNWVDESVLVMLSDRKPKVSAKIYTQRRRITEKLQLSLAKHSQQYEPIEVEALETFHDRFLIIDNTVYAIGASMKDLGIRLFAFFKMEIKPGELMRNVCKNDFEET